ncbi:MAG: hypothetical protein M1827_003157 [Pycnora praestabilis]|nr:MAG: hypothetical protein M1827_003157 [Pycnora praestabilis]
MLALEIGLERRDGPLTRTYTAPNPVHGRSHNNPTPSPLIQTQTHAPQYTNLSQSSTYRNPARPPVMSNTNGLGGSGSHQPQPPTNGGPVADSDSIVNQTADKTKSLYQICLNLRQRLQSVPGFEQHLIETDDDDEADDATDPVTSMWRCFRRGYPLMTVYNALGPAVPLEINPSKVAEAKRGKAATFKFLEACLTDLRFDPGDCFLITDLYGDDTTGFVKVTKVVNRVLDVLQERGLLFRSEPADQTNPLPTAEKKTYKEHILEEIITTERKYVQDLEALQQFKKLVEESGVINGDAVHDIFLNLNALLDFQRRFLIRIESMYSLPMEEQNWGKLFIQYNDSFSVYEPYLANHRKSEETATREYERLKSLRDPVVKGPHDLQGFLLKPFQRLSKYPLLLKNLRDGCDLDLKQRAELTAGIKAATDVLERANSVVDKEARFEAMNDLSSRVEDWKGHKIEHFGDLLLYGTYTVLKGDGIKDVERENRRIPVRSASIPATPVFEVIASERASSPHIMEADRASKLIKVLNRSDSVLPVHEVLEGSERSFCSKEIAQVSPPLSHSHSSFFPSDESIQVASEEQKITKRHQSIKIPAYDDNSESHMSHIEGLGFSEQQKTPISPKTIHMQNNAGFNIHQPKSTNTSPQSPNNSAYAMPGGMSIWSTKFESTLRWGHSSCDDFQGGVGSGTLTQYTLSPKSKTTSSPGQLGMANDIHGKAFRQVPLGRKGKRRNAFTHQDLTSFLKFNGPFSNHSHFFSRTGQTSGLSPLEIAYANEKGMQFPFIFQYKVYLFERILLCCKEINPNKQKNKIMGTNKPAVDKKGRLKLQLKGRIFMQNVTETVSLQKPGSYTIQIFWKGDPGVENFVIRFSQENTMKKWYKQVEAQRVFFSEGAKALGSRPSGTSETEFTYMKNQGAIIQNPYQQEEDVEEDEGEQAAYPAGTIFPSIQSEFSMSRNASSTSLRSRSTTGDSGPPMAQGTRVPPPRFPMAYNPTPPLTLHTQLPNSAPSPAERAGASYFSPGAESPMSTRTSGSSGMYPFPRQATPNNGFPGEEQNRFTAPAMGRSASREGQSVVNGYYQNGRVAQRPSLPVPTSSQITQQGPIVQNRLRSASSPDMHNPNLPGRRGVNGNIPPPIPDVPVPHIPPHMAQIRAPPNRSQNNSPTNGFNGLPMRTATQSPGLQRDRVPHQNHVQHQYQQQHSVQQGYDQYSARLDPRHGASSNESEVMPPPLSSAPPVRENIPVPTQLKVKVTCDKNYVTLVAGMNITYQTLVDRIDAKLSRFTSASVGRGTIGLRYVDEDGDTITICSDEDVQNVFADWREQHQKQKTPAGQMGEIHFDCHSLAG